MARIIASSVAAMLIIIATTPMLAAAANDGWYPGDAPPSANPAGQHDGTSPSCAGGRVCADGGGSHPANPIAFSVGPNKP